MWFNSGYLTCTVCRLKSFAKQRSNDHTKIHFDDKSKEFLSVMNALYGH